MYKRQIPASGTFSPAQRQVHDLVEKSHRAGLAAVQPGRLWADFHAACMEVLAEGLHDWGMLPVSVDEALSEGGQHHRRYIVCGVGHHLGLDVHDCDSSRYETYLGGTVQTGMALTVEPGLYFHAWDETVPPELRGIGVRIEDDLVVTETGIEVISDAVSYTHLDVYKRQVFPWMFEEISSLRSYEAATKHLAEHEQPIDTYDIEQLAVNQVPVEAAVYFDDMYVDAQLSLDTASRIAGMHAWVTNEFEHDGLRLGDVAARLFTALEARIGGTRSTREVRN